MEPARFTISSVHGEVSCKSMHAPKLLSSMSRKAMAIVTQLLCEVLTTKGVAICCARELLHDGQRWVFDLCSTMAPIFQVPKSLPRWPTPDNLPTQ